MRQVVGRDFGAPFLIEPMSSSSCSLTPFILARRSRRAIESSVAVSCMRAAEHSLMQRPIMAATSSSAYLRKAALAALPFEPQLRATGRTTGLLLHGARSYKFTVRKTLQSRQQVMPSARLPLCTYLIRGVPWKEHSGRQSGFTESIGRAGYSCSAKERM